MTTVSRRLALSLAVGLGVGACAKPIPTPQPNPAPSSPSPSPTPTPTPTDSRPRWPLTGELIKDPARARRAAVAVKVPDNQQEHPQRGIDEADIVFVELEGYRNAAGYSATRLVPVFHSRWPESVAPVRSIRPVDVALLSPMDAVIGNTGGAPWVINYVKANRSHLEGELSYIATVGTGSYGTDPARVYAQNGQTYYDRAVVCHPSVLAAQTKRFRTGPPQAYFPFATGQEKPSTERSGTPATAIEVPYQGTGYRMGYRYHAQTRRYRRSMPWGEHRLADGTRVSCDNVLIIAARQHYGKIFTGSGHEEPLHDITDAEGPFHYAHRGRVVTGRWRKAGVAEPFRFTLENGEPMRMNPGQTFVELPDLTAKVAITG